MKPSLSFLTLAIAAIATSSATAQVRLQGFPSKRVPISLDKKRTEEKPSSNPRVMPISPPSRQISKTPAIKPPPRPNPPTKVDAAKMISVLKGKPSTTSTVKPPTTNRVTKLDPKVMPKGYESFRMKKGRDSAEGLPLADKGSGSKTTYMKKGRDHAEGVPVYPTRIKDGRESASGTIDAGTKSNFSQYDRITAPGYNSRNDSYSGGHASAPSSLSYQVDASSQLSTDAVRFRKNSTELADQYSYEYLMNLSDALRDPELRGFRFVVEGHASADGSDYANLLLSQRRANAIFDFLISRGVDPDSLLAVGHGESHARFAAHEPEYLLAQDRQVVVFKLAD